MHAGLPRGAGAPEGLLLLFGAGLLMAFALFEADGSSYGPLVAIGAAAIALAGATLALGFFGRLPWPRLDRIGLAFVGLLAAFVVWNGLSVLWSVAPDRSWEYVNRGFVYLAFTLLGVFVGAAAPWTVRAVAGGLAVLLAAVLVWALAGKVVPNLFPDGARIARLRDPIGYWNGLALLAAIALVLGLWFAVRREHPRPLRAGAVVLCFLATVALLLTYSRGGVVVALIAVAVFLALCTERLEAVAALLIAVVPAIVVAGWAFSQPGIVDDMQPYDDRLHSGLILGAALVVAGGLVGVAAYVAASQEVRWSTRLRWKVSGLQLAGGAAAALLVAVLAASGGHPLDWARDGFREFTNPVSAAGTGPERLANLSSNSRWTWWEEAWTLFEDDPVTGKGAASFAVARRPIRTNTTFATEPHNIALQFLAETGVIGFLLIAATAAAATLGIVAAVRRLPERDAAAASALAVGGLAYLLHALIDYDWDFVALTGPIMLVVGVLIASGRPSRRRARSPLWAVASVLAAAAVIFSLAAPWVAARDVADAYAAIGRDDPRKALDEARRARSLNPVSIEPLLAEAAAEDARGDDRAALERYADAVELQPENWRTWYALGRFELNTGQAGRAVVHLRRARELDPLGPANDLLVSLGL
jgi:O-Antigen ligase